MSSESAISHLVAEEPRKVASVSFWTSFGHELRHSKLGIFSVVTLSLLVLLAIFAPFVSPYDPVSQDLSAQFQPPSAAHLFGTDEFGRDLFTRVLFGARVSLTTGVFAVVIALIVGVPLGLIAGYFGKFADTIIMRFLDFLMSIPAILLAMAIISVLGVSSTNAMIAVAIVSIPTFSRLARASTLMQKGREYVDAARVIGGTDSYIIMKTILPNTVGPLIVQVTIAAAIAILLEASLSFLGLGTRPPDPSWGSMLSAGRGFLSRAWWYGLFPGVALTLLVVSLNFLSDMLSSILDPRQRSLRATRGQ